MRTKIKFKAGPLHTVADLAEALDLDVSDLEYVLMLEGEARYKETKIQKADGRIRQIYKPCTLIRKIQRRIKNRLFCALEWPIYLYGSIPADEDNNHDFIECARHHCGAKSLLKLDIEDFFDNITENLVKQIFIKIFHYSEELSVFMAKLCCHEGKVPQGGITSSYLAALALYSIEEDLYFRLKSKKLTYTRYVDDITISSKNMNFNFDIIIKIVEGLLNSLDLPLNKNKIEVARFSSTPLKVHNVRVDFKEPRYDQEEVKKIRAMINRLEKVVKQPNHRTHYYYRMDYNSCMGFVNKLGRVNHPSYMKFKNKLLKIKPLPNKSDIDATDEMIKILSKMNVNDKNLFIFKKRFYKIQFKIGFIKSHPKGIYKNEAFYLNQKLQQYRLKNGD